MANVSRGNFMMKKLIALGLCLLMVLSVCLTGCSEKTNEEAVADISEKASKSAMTLSLYLMSDAEVNKCDYCEKYDAGEPGAKTCVDLNAQPCTFRLISNAVNRVTESKFKTRLVLHYYTEAEYYQKLEESFAMREAAKKAGLIGNTQISEESTEDETFINELGQVEIKYPTIAGYQVDLFYFGGQEKFEQYSNGGLLSALDGQLKDASKKLTQYIRTPFLNGIKTLGGGTTYAIPSNRTVGEYTYLLVNKEALKRAYRTENVSYSMITSTDSQEFLDHVATAADLKDLFYPIHLGEGLTLADIATTQGDFFGVDAKGNFTNDFSVIGGYYQSGQDSFANAFSGGKILSNASFKEQLKVLKDYENKNYFEEVEGKEFAVGYVKGDISIEKEYEDDYYVFKLASPTMYAEELCEHLMGVSSTTTSLSRSMQILTFLNTDEEFRNLLLYGIEGTHYLLEETDVEKKNGEGNYLKVTRIRTDYLMDENKTGNVFIAYPLYDQNEPEAFKANIRDLGIEQNQELLIDPMLSFVAGFTKDFDIDMEAMQLLRLASEEILEEYLTCSDYSAFETFANNMLKMEKVETALANMTDYKHDAAGKAACEKICGSFGCAFTEWAVQNKLMVQKTTET